VAEENKRREKKEKGRGKGDLAGIERSGGRENNTCARERREWQASPSCLGIVAGVLSFGGEPRDSEQAEVLPHLRDGLFITAWGKITGAFGPRNRKGDSPFLPNGSLHYLGSGEAI